jgi:predicted phosphoribosyltransferase
MVRRFSSFINITEPSGRTFPGPLRGMGLLRKIGRVTGPSSTAALYPTRSAAGAVLARQLYQRCIPPVILLGVTPTGVEIAASATEAIAATFDVIVGAHVRIEGYGIVGAVAEDSDAVIDQRFQPRFELVDPLNEAIDKARRAVKSERLLFRGQRRIRELADQTVVVIDGHVTNPWKLLAAAQTVQRLEARRVLVAAAVATEAVKERVLAYKFEFVCPTVVLDPEGHPRPFGDPQDPSAERLRSIVVARQAAA